MCAHKTIIFSAFIICEIFLTHQHVLNSTTKAPKTCGLERKCDTNSGVVCRYDDKMGCIRKYDSICHLEIAACRSNTTFNDYSNDYCSMESYLCEEGYERWTIFFGHEK